jgi:hypothetical protein
VTFPAIIADDRVPPGWVVAYDPVRDPAGDRAAIFVPGHGVYTTAELHHLVRQLEAADRWRWRVWLLERVDLPPIGTHPSPYLAPLYAYAGA